MRAGCPAAKKDDYRLNHKCNCRQGSVLYSSLDLLKLCEIETC